MSDRIIRLVLAMFACWSGISQASTQTGDIATDSRLQKPISLKLKIASVSTALAEISKQTGVTLDRSVVIKDLNVTVMIQSQLAGPVLSAIAKTLGCEWRADGSIYRLTMSSDEQAALSRLVDAEESAALKELTDEVTFISGLGQENPTEARKELLGLTDPANKQPANPERIAYLQRAINRQDVILGRLFGALPGDRVTAFWRGDVIPTPANIVTQKLSDVDPTMERSPIGRKGRGFQPGTSMDSMPLFIQLDPYLFRIQILQGFGVRYVSKRLPNLVLEDIPAGKFAKLKFGKEVLAWDQPVPNSGDWSNLAVRKSTIPSLNFNERYTLADFLEKAFDQTGQSFVADAFRIPADSKDINRGSGSLSTWLDTLKADNHLTTHFENGIAMLRHGGFWRLRKFEAPEDVFVSLEDKYAKGPLTLADYSTVVAKLTPEQSRAMTLPGWVTAEFDCGPIEDGLPGLKFYGMLDQRQISRAMDDGIAYSEMSTSLRQGFYSAAIDGIFYSAAAPAFYDDLYRFAIRGDSRRFGFVMRTEDKKVKERTVPGQDLIFGLNASQATIYRLAVEN